MYPFGTSLYKQLRLSRLTSAAKQVVRRHLMEVCCGVVLAGAGIYLLTIGIQLTRGVSMTVHTPGHVIRLHVVDGSDDNGALEAVRGYLETLQDPELQIEIAAADQSTTGDIDETLVISRQPDLTAARLLATRLGLESDRVMYKPLVHNLDQVSVTLMLGRDAGTLPAVKPEIEEKQQKH
jgi:hypothetical protein